MIELERTRDGLLRDIGAASPPTTAIEDPADPRLLDAAEARLLLRGHTRQELFPPLEIVLSGRFAAEPRDRLHRDLLVPLRSALGNAHKRGNGADARKWISVEAVLTARGALLAIHDEGEGFDYAGVLEHRRRRERYFAHRGTGFGRFDRARSVVTWSNGGRTFLLRFDARRGERGDDRSRRDAPGLDAAPRGGSLGNGDAADASLRNATDGAWMRARLIEELPDLAPEGATIQWVRPTVTGANAERDHDLRYVLSVAAGGAAPLRVLSGRLHADAAAAARDFDAAALVRRELRFKSVSIARPLARLACEPRLVLYDVHPWMTFSDYLDDRGDEKTLRSRAERIARALAALHTGDLAPLDPPEAALRAQVASVVERVGGRRPAASSPAGWSDRLRAIERALETRLETPPRHGDRRAPIHGRFGFDCVLYDVDGGFFLHRFEACRRAQPALDLGGFLADLWLWSSSAARPDAYAAGERAFLDEYDARTPGAPRDDDLAPYVALALLERIDRRLRSPDRDLEPLLAECERRLGCRFGSKPI